MEPQTILFTCDWCGKEFPAEPDCMVETGFTMNNVNKEAAEAWKGEGTEIDIKRIPDDVIEEMKVAMGLDYDQIKTLVETGSVNDLASCVCRECQEDCTEEGVPI